MLRALRPLAPGDAVSISYIELTAPAGARRAELAASCVGRCTLSAPRTLWTWAATSRSYLFDCGCARCAADSAREEELRRKAEMLATARAAALTAIDAGAWAEAAAASARCCELCESLSPTCSAPLGIERLRLGKLLAHEERLGEAAAAWRLALHTLRLTHGPSSALVRKLDADLQGVEGELQAAGRARLD